MTKELKMTKNAVQAVEQTILGDLEVLAVGLAETRERARELEEKLETMRRGIRSRGTGDLAAQAAAAVAQVSTESAKPVEPERPDLRSRIQMALTRESLSDAQLVTAVGEPSATVATMMRALKSKKQVHNVGSAEHPVWTWRIGDDTPTAVLTDVVRRLISERPMTTRELADATGARLSRVGGSMVTLQRGTEQVLNLGEPHTGRWFIVSAKAKIANLSPKGDRKRSKK